MTFVVIYNDEKEEFDDPRSANEFAVSTGLGFSDVVIIDTDIDECERFLRD